VGWTPFSTAKNPEHEFTITGLYDIRLYVENEFGNDTLVKYSYIDAGNKPVSAFSADKAVADLADSIQFTDSSTNSPSSWKWEYKVGAGDWTQFSTSQNPQYEFPGIGVYDIRLTAVNAYGESIETKSEYIDIGNKPVSAFSADKTVADLADSIQFTDSSTNSPSSWKWEYKVGEGEWTQFSTSQNPTYTFPGEDTYSVRLTVSNTYGETTETKSIGVYLAPTASFSAATTSTTPDTDIQFSDESLGNPDTWHWQYRVNGAADWIDFSQHAVENPVQQFSTTGTYDIRLHVTSTGGNDTEIKLAYIDIGNKPVASFSQAQTPGMIQFVFNDSSTNTPASWSWNFGDGNSSSTQNPTHTYVSEGSYIVTLTATNAYGYDTDSQTAYAYFKPIAGFTALPTTGIAPLIVQFTDSSTNNPTSWKWEYRVGAGDWTQFSTSQHLFYQFASGGLYSIRLTATNSGGNDTVTRTEYIEVINPVPVANFISDQQYSFEAPVSITFSDMSSHPATSWAWYTKKSSSSSWTHFSTNQNPSYTYTEYGLYDVRLFISTVYGDSTEDKLGYIIIDSSIRPKTNVKANVPPTHHYQTVIGAFGADVPQTSTPAEIEWMDIAGAIEGWYTDSLGMFFYVFVFSIPFVIQYLRQGTMIIPSVLGIITAGFLLMYVPAEYELVAVAFIALGVLGILWGVIKERM